MPHVQDLARFSIAVLGLAAGLLLAGPQWLRAQEAEPAAVSDRFYDGPTEYVTKQWTTENGLPHNSVYAVEQGERGALWVGTLGGLARFDGHAFTTFDGATNGLAGNRIHALHQASDGRLWIGTVTGTSVYQNGRFRRVDGTSDVRVIEEGGNGTIWMGGIDGLYRSRSGTVAKIALPDSIERTRVRDVEAVGADSAWVVVGAYLLLYRNGDFERPYRLGGKERWVNRVEQAPDGRLWVSLESQVASIHEGTITRWDVDSSREESVRIGQSGAAWLTMPDGLLRLTPSSNRPVRIDGDLPGRLMALKPDDSGQWWIGTYNQGLIRLRPRLFRHFDEGPAAGTAVHGVSVDDRDVLWAGIFGTGVVRVTESDQSFWTRDDGLPHHNVWTVGHDATGAPWIATNEGLVRRRGARFDLVLTSDGEPFRLTQALYRDSTGTLWISNPDRGLYRYRADTLSRVLSPDRLSLGVHALHRTRDGALWIGTRSRGVGRYHDEAITWYGPDDGLPYKYVRDIHETSDGTLWVGTYGGGIARFEGEGFTPVTPKDGLPAGTIHTIHEAPDGIFWMTSNEGVFRVPRSQVEAVADGRRDRLYAQTFGVDDGMPSRECNGNFHPALAEDRAGRLWIPTMEGLTAVDPSSPMLTVPDSLPVRVTAIRADEQARPLDSLRLAPSTYRVALDFTAVSVRHADDLSFRYRLDGETWTSAHGRRTAEFTSLGAGTHRFEVQATVNGEQWYTLGSPFRFTIAPHFYETWWFHLLVVLGVIGLAVGIYRWRTVRLRKRQEELENAVDERTRQLQARTEELAEEKEKTERQAEKLAELDEAKNRFFAHVSHEFRTPLSLILSPLEESLRHAEALGTEQKQRMVDNARRLQRLIDQLLDLATLEAGRMELERQPGDLASVVERSAEAFRSKAEQKEIDLRVERPEGRIETRFDPEKVETIVSNLVGNAVKFTPTGGTVTIHVEATESTAPVEAPGEAESAQGTAVIEVDDTGPGIDPAVQETIFDRFEQADTSTTRTHEGTGLGLALTSELVELHGGTIDVDSAPGEGATFAVQLPVVPVAEASMGARERGSTRARGSTGDGEQESVGEGERERGGEGARERGGEGAREHGRVGDGERGGVGDGERGRVGARETESVGEREHGSVGERERGGDGREQSEREAEETSEAEATILVVEDNAEMRAYLREQFAERWAVIEAADGEAGWQRVQEDEPDLVLSDVMMPALDGFELCRRIKTDEEFRTIPVLLLTARAGEEATREGLRCGADDYVAKPFDAQELRQRIANHLAARRHLQARYRTEVDLGTAVVDEADRPFVEEFLETIDDHLGNPDLTVGDLADEMALSRRQLTRRVKRTTGEAPGTVLRTHRIERAKAMLERDPETIAEVAYAVGFQSSSAFSRSFREHVGTSPSTYVEEQGS